MERRISLREANHRFSEHVKAVERGEELVITRRGRPIARLSPYDGRSRLGSEQLAALERSLLRMNRGYRLGGGHARRPEPHER